MPLQRVPLNNFRGGLNTRDGPFDLQPNESPSLLNVTLTSLVGQLRMRDGKSLFASPVDLVDNMQQIVLGTSTRWLMCSINGTVYSCSTTGVLTSRFVGTVGTVWSFVQFIDAAGNDMVWMQNGVDAPQKWNGVAATTSAWAGAPPNGGILRIWRNKMVVSGVAATNNRVFFSKFGDPELTTGAYDFLDMRGPDDEADAITEMNVLNDRLYVFNSRSVWVVNDPVSLANRRQGQPGCTGRFQSDVLEEKLYWFNEQGLWSTGGVAVTLESGSITNYFPSNLNFAQVSKARVLATRDSYPRLLLAIPTGTNTVNSVLIELIPHINFRRIGGRRYLLLPAFMLHSLRCHSLCNFKVNNQWQIMAGDSTTNKIHHIFDPVATTDDGAVFSAYWQSSWIAIQGEEPFERVRRVNVELSGDAIVDVYSDFKVGPDFSATLPDPGGSLDGTWDNPPHTWDETGQWDPVPVFRFARIRPESRGRFHSIKFRNVPGAAPFLINVAELAIRGGKEH